jgi:hypothetical protein
MVKVETRFRAADVLSYALFVAGLVAAIVALVGVFVDFGAAHWAGLFVGLGGMIGFILAWLLKGLEDEADLMIQVMVADALFLLLVLAALAFAGEPWSWVPLVAYVTLIAAGVVCITRNSESVITIGFWTVAAGVITTAPAVAWYMVIGVPDRNEWVTYVLALVPCLMYSEIVRRRVWAALDV